MKKMVSEGSGESRRFVRLRKIAGNFSTGRKSKAGIFVLLVFCVLYLPFIDKAFHIDDVDFIRFSELIGWNPLHATPIDYPDDGYLMRDSLPAYEMTHPLLVPYVIKVVTALFGQVEVVLHLSFLFFSLLALSSIFILYRVLFPDSKDSGALVVLFLSSMPAFLVNSHNIMTDVPTLSFVLLSAVCYCMSVEKNSATLAYLGGIALCLATFTSYQALFFCPVIFLYILIRRRLSIHYVLSLAIPGVVLLVWFLMLYRLYDIFPLLKGRGASDRNLISDIINMGMLHEALFRKGLSVLAFIGSGMLCIVPAYLFLNKSGVKFFWILLLLTPIAYFAVFKLTGYSFSENAFLSLLIALGLLTLLITVKESLMPAYEQNHKARVTFLLSWVFLVVTYNMLIFPWVAARHILPVFPPLVMVLVDGMKEFDRMKKRRIVLLCALSLSVFLGVGSAYSDYKFAESYREVARDIKILNPGGNNMWYIGKWGMKYYMEKAGARYLLATSDEPKAGDLVIVPEMPRFWSPSPQLQMRLGILATKTAVSPFPLRLFNGRSHAGFYSNTWGLLPFSLSQEPDEVFTALQVLR